MYSKFTPDPALIDTTLLVRDSVEPSKVQRNGNYIRWGVTDEILKYFDGLDYIAGNIYYHTDPYEVHTDVFADGIGVNVLVPLERERSQKFVVFDQTFSGSTVWQPNKIPDGYKVEKKGMNVIVHGRPCDTMGVQNLTGKPCPQNLTQHLPEEPEFYHGLSGKLIEWKPGEGLVFPSTNLHATGKMESPKYGLAMWFNNSVQDVCSVMKK